MAVSETVERSGARVFLNGCRTDSGGGFMITESGARVFLNGCRTPESR